MNSNNSNSSSIIGKCNEMCPADEVLQRQMELSFSRYETFHSDRAVHKQSKLEPTLAVKAYRRAAAGKEGPLSKYIRPPKVLGKTIEHLLNSVLSKGCSENFEVMYNFIDDRLRCVRQDFAIQAVVNLDLVHAYERISKFYIFSNSMLLYGTGNAFNEKLHQEQLLSSLVALRQAYQHYDETALITPKEELESAVKFRETFAAYDILLRLGQSAWTDVAQLPVSIQHSSGVKLALEVSLAFVNCDYNRFFTLVKDRLSYLDRCCIVHVLPQVWQEVLLRLNKAYTKQDKFRLDPDLSRILWINDIPSLVKVLRIFEIPVTDKGETTLQDSWEDTVSLEYATFKVQPVKRDLSSDCRKTLLEVAAFQVESCSTSSVEFHKRI